MSKKYTDISKFLSYILRHQPEAVGLSLDKDGWAVITDLILFAKQEGYILDPDIIQAVITSSDKKRFILSDDGLHIRAAQGHSTQQVDIAYQEKTPPDILYHGTATRFISEIREQGLLPMSRQYVHLSTDEVTAIQVGQRHGKPLVLKIKALTMYEQGFKFFQAENGVWLTSSVPYQFIQE
ncbi:RNA 2'-phosphotransferase [Pantoea dispersa]|uniref:Probable RNA 2'-phosphotransferase n=1 Tax=Pantoea dispersa TaxID=59814 RepID=A0A8E1S2C3_9GAMM|nr:RNA 2'-phosphotransferase [Pantoea dispersa]KTR88020.1 RNA 2'-phosphotransferase [Pantoea dispersa]KTS19963.1 RNA 2'-phosphotransferase [Pantoea dispersa]KTS56727.1 RNA 2'-phosphotransferase [Pantoea dispersa]KTS69652.1 RNA 2'-phosphotransferase [Pantoea dispersa]